MEENRIKVLIVDDEPLARRKIREILLEDPEIEVIGECGSGKEAVAEIRKKNPDLLFLDVQMPGMDGFGVVKELGTQLPLIIFVTAYDQYALHALEVSALDYLLKPFDSERFEKTVRRAKTTIRQERNGDLTHGVQVLLQELQKKSGFLERLVIKTGPRVFFVKTDEIDWYEAEGNYVRLHMGKESHLLREAISNLETQLDPKKFLRIHRSTIVNVDRIKELQSWFHGEYHVILKDGTQLLLTRSYRDNLKDLLGRQP